jgi:hypothetical protein
MQDPYHSTQGLPYVRRILGNIGKPGINFMLPPQEPMIRDQNPRSWKLDSYLPFDGTPSRSFENTSVHLSFTDYHVPIYDGTSIGAQDTQIFYLETVLSVRDKGEWVADVDPLPIMGSVLYNPSTEVVKLPAPLVQLSCQHAKNSNQDENIIAVDS